MIERRKDCDHGEKCLVIVILTIVANIPVYLRKVVAYYFDSNNTADSNYYYSSLSFSTRLELFEEIPPRRRK